MKSLDEVIKGMECISPYKENKCSQCPYEEIRKNTEVGIGVNCVEVMIGDATYYLNRYRELIKNSEQMPPERTPNHSVDEVIKIIDETGYIGHIADALYYLKKYRKEELDENA